MGLVDMSILDKRVARSPRGREYEKRMDMIRGILEANPEEAVKSYERLKREFLSDTSIPLDERKELERKLFSLGVLVYQSGRRAMSSEKNKSKTVVSQTPVIPSMPFQQQRGGGEQIPASVAAFIDSFVRLAGEVEKISDLLDKVYRDILELREKLADVKSEIAELRIRVSSLESKIEGLRQK